MAFADDLVLLSSSWRDMCWNLAILEDFCDRTGLRVQPKKCRGFLIQSKAKSLSVNRCPPWSIDGSPIDLTQPNEVVKYLGVGICPKRGIVIPNMKSRLLDWIGKIGRSGLRPSWKVWMLNRFALPRVLYMADHGETSKSALASVDGIVRSAVKEWLHLHGSTCNGLLYSGARDGGLGLMKLESVIPSVQARRYFRLLDSKDKVTRALMAANDAESNFQRLWLEAGGGLENMPLRTNGRGPTLQGTLIPPDWRSVEKERWTSLRVQGVGAKSFSNDKISNSWLIDPWHKGLEEKHFIAALQLRSNTFPTRESSARGRINTPKGCRGCPALLESTSHILGSCPLMKSARILKHNKLCKMLGMESQKHNWRLHSEPRIIGPEGEIRIPDIVLTRDATVVVIDVTVRFELNTGTLRRAAAEKVSYYEPYHPQIKEMFKADKVRIFGFPLGARGKWHPENNKILSFLGVPPSRIKSFGKLMSKRALLYSIELLGWFQRRVGSPSSTGSLQSFSGETRVSC